MYMNKQNGGSANTKSAKKGNADFTGTLIIMGKEKVLKSLALLRQWGNQGQKGEGWEKIIT